MPGMPGTGLGGVFYALLIMWIALRELWLTTKHVSGRDRWRKLGGFIALLGGIIAAFWSVAWLIKLVAGRFAPQSSAAALEQIKVVEALIPALAMLPFLTLACLLTIVQVARLLIPRTELKSTQTDATLPPIAAEART